MHHDPVTDDKYSLYKKRNDSHFEISYDQNLALIEVNSYKMYSSHDAKTDHLESIWDLHEF